MYYGEIKERDIANGEGVRTSLFVSGCRLHCKDCFNSATWDFCYGNEFTKEVERRILKSLEPSFIAGLTVLGGEPMEPENQAALLQFLRDVKSKFPNKKLWVFTGYVFDKDLISGGRKHGAHTDELLKCIDILVDGPFVCELKKVGLKFRGSSNQRIIDVPRSLESDEVVIYEI